MSSDLSRRTWFGLAGATAATAEMEHPGRHPEARIAVAGGQQPFAVIVSCSDSRVPPELLVDQGFGDLFVVRVAGNVIGRSELGSVEYAVGTSTRR